MATIYLRGEIWWARWYQAGGKRVSASTGSRKKRDAQRIAAQLEAADRNQGGERTELARGYQRILDRAAADARAGKLDVDRAEQHLRDIRQLADPSFRVVTLREQIATWVAAQAARVAPKTAAIYSTMEAHFSKAMPAAVLDAPVSELTPAQVETAVHKIAARPVARTEKKIRGATVNQSLRALRRALQPAVVAGLARHNAAAAVQPLPESDSTERAPFTHEEVRALIDHPDTSDEWHGAILVAAHTGLRLSDVVNLSDVHLSGSSLVIRPGKTTKKRKTIRVPLSPPCLAWLTDRAGDYFPTLRKSPTGTLSTQFSRIMSRAGVPRDVTLPGGIPARRSFHSLRHTFASWLAEADIHADIRQKLTGHSSPGVHARYTHHDESLERAIAVLPDLKARASGSPPPSKSESNA